MKKGRKTHPLEFESEELSFGEAGIGMDFRFGGKRCHGDMTPDQLATLHGLTLRAIAKMAEAFDAPPKDGEAGH